MQPRLLLRAALAPAQTGRNFECTARVPRAARTGSRGLPTNREFKRFGLGSDVFKHAVSALKKIVKMSCHAYWNCYKGRNSSSLGRNTCENLSNFRRAVYGFVRS